jgi:hypothetical protein
MWRAYCRASGAITIGILLVLGVMAQASAQSLRDFGEIQASPVAVTPDPGGRSAVLEVDTSIDVACSVVYGEDESFGLIAVDSDMDGGAHADHQPVLGGLEPDTEYHYRLQGTAPDGSMYVSEVMTFRTPPEPVGGPINLALGADVTGVSSEWSDAFAASNAFDGDATTEWSSRGDGDDAWVEIDLGSPQQIDELVLRTRSMNDGTSITDTYAVTADGVLLGEFNAEEAAAVDVVAQVLRFDVVSSSGGNTGAIEILVLADDTDVP